MAQTRRAQILMEPAEYAQLEQIAQNSQTSVAELIRRAVRERYLTEVTDKYALVERIAGLNLDVDDWESMKQELQEAHCEGIS